MTAVAKRIWIIRHGKSSRPFGVIDHKRPLAKRASNDAIGISQHLGNEPALYVSSTALRAMQTARLLAGKREIQPSEQLYEATTDEFMAVVEEFLATSNHVAFIAHNPAVTALVNHLAGQDLTDNVPTLGVASFERRKSRWRLLNYVTPKELR